MSEKVPRTTAELEQELNDQLELLKLDAKNYDEGKEIVAKTMSSKLRNLFHDSRTCHSLLRQTGKAGALFYDTAGEREPQPQNAYSGLIIVSLYTNNPKYIAPLDNLPQRSTRQISFDDWWNGIVFVDQERNKFARKDLVLSLAEQDGGSHVDRSLEKKYYALAKQNALGWHARTTHGTYAPLTNPHYAAVRQITHETLKSLLLGYTPPIQTLQEGIYLAGLHVTPAPPTPPSRKPKIGRNDPCPCNSGKKYKKCHGS